MEHNGVDVADATPAARELALLQRDFAERFSVKQCEGTNASLVIIGLATASWRTVHAYLALMLGPVGTIV